MKTNLQKFRRVTLLVLLLTVASITKAFAGDRGPNDFITFADANVKALCVAKWDTNGDGELSYAEAAAVTSLGYNVFESNQNITSFDELEYFTGLTRIVRNTFSGCVNLASIKLPPTITEIGDFAFYNCSSLSSIFIPASVTMIGNGFGPFNYCSALTNIEVDAGNTVYDSRDNCNAIIQTETNILTVGCKNTTIPNTVAGIIAYSFKGCGITSLTIPASVTYVDIWAFQDCPTLAHIEVEPGNRFYDSRNDCNAIINTSNNTLCLGCKNTVIPNTVTAIDHEAFCFCYDLETITIPSSVTSIGSDVFAYCTSLTEMTIPASVVSIGSSAFGHCYALTQLVVESGNTVYDSRDNCNAIIRTADNTLYIGCNGTVIPNTVTAIENSAFYGCQMLTTITIPELVTAIGNYAFDHCIALDTITVLSTTPPTLGSNVFFGVTKTIPVYVPVGTVEAYQTAEGWSEFTNIQVNPLDFPIEFADANVKALCVANWDTNGDGELSYAEAAAVTDLGTVFKSNSTITSFDELQYFIGLTTLGEHEFSQCSNLTSIVMPNTLTSIGNYAFGNCSSLISLIIPASVTSIGTGTFNYCNGLEQIVVESGNAVYDSRDNCNAVIETSTNTLLHGGSNSTIPSSVTAIGSGAFCGRNGLTSVVISDNILTLGGSAFESCINLTSAVVGNAVTTIGTAAFSNCASLATIVIGESVSLMDYWVFNSCESIESMTVLAETPPTVRTGAYATFYIANRDFPVYVPAGTVATYQAAVGWSSLTNIQVNPIYPIEFADANVKALCVANWDTNGDGELSYNEAAAVTDLGEVFKYNSNITSFDELQYFTGLTTIGSKSFLYCSHMTSVVIPNSVTSLATEAFYGCKGLTSLYIPSGVSALGQSVFSSCSGLEQIVVDEGNTTFDSRNGCNAIILTATNKLVAGCKNTVIPDEITIIGRSAFFDQDGIVSITLPSSLTTIEKYAFGLCNNLASITIPNTVTYIGETAFSNCRALTTLTIPSSVTTIVTGAFKGCSGLDTIIVDSANPNYDSRDNCNGIIETSTNILVVGCKTTVIPNTVVAIGESAFEGHDIVSLDVPNSVTSIGSSAFPNSKITNITLPETLTTLGRGAFQSCDYLTSIVIPDLVTTIDEYTFNWCEALTSVTLGSSVSLIKNNAFSHSGLNVITVRAETPPTLVGANVFGSVNLNIPVYVPAGTVEAYQAASGWSEFTNIQVNPIDLPIEFADANVKALCVANWDTNGDGELSYNEAAAVTDLGQVFKNNSTITSFDELQYFTGLTAIGNYAFYYCTNMASVVLPNSIVSIGSSAFFKCSSLTSITITSQVASMGYASFGFCSSLEHIIVDEGNVVFDSRNGCNAVIETETNNLVIGCKNTVIPNGVTAIGIGAFAGHSGLVSINLPNTITSIQSEAFIGCQALEDISIPNSVTTIGANAFTSCYSFTTLDIPNSVNSIASNAFKNCRGVESVNVAADNPNYDSRNDCNAIIETNTNTLIFGCKNTIIPNDVTAIGNTAFYGQTDIVNITIPNSVTSIGNSAFSQCTNLASVSIPASVTTIGSGAFQTCSALVSVEIPDMLTTIDEYAFSLCINLKSVIIGASVSSIKNNAFSHSGLNVITVRAETPPTLVGANVFGSVNLNIPVYVPCNSTDAYTTANWGGFSNILGLCSGEISASVYPEGSGTVTGTGLYEGGSICTLTAIANGEHIQFLNWTKDGEVVSSDETFSFLVTGDAAYVANFEQSEIVGGGGTATNEFLPTFSYYCYSLTQQIYTSDEIGGAQTIDSIAFYNGGATKTRTLDIYMVTTDKTVFESSTDWIPVTESDLVFSGTVTMEANRWTVFHFNNAFAYDGVANLALITDDNTGAYTGAPHMACRVYDADGNQAIRIYSDNTNYDANNPAAYYGTRLTVKNQLKIYSNITFADANVKAICVENWDTNGDGELNFAEAAAVTDLGEVFKNKRTITSFNELQYFTGLTEIGEQAFYNCSDLGSVVIPNTVTKLKTYAFGSSGLESVVIPDGVTTIEQYAFYCCYGLHSVVLGSSVTSMTYRSFIYCSGIESITVDPNNTKYDSRDNCNAIIETATNKLVYGCKNTVIPSSVATINESAFVGSGIVSVEIPSWVTEIGMDVFSNCSSLVQITVNEANTVYDSRNDCNAIIHTSSNKLISGCKNTIIPNTVTEIGSYAFSGFHELLSIDIPNSVRVIGSSAFNNCQGLHAITIPGSVTNIQSYAFSSCIGLESITVLANTPPTMGLGVFNNVNKSIPVYVPAGTIPAYQATSGWSEFTNYQEIEIGITQTIELFEGWNWISTYIMVDDPEAMLLNVEESIGENGLQIKSMDDYTTYDDGEWGAMGDLEEMYNEQMYAIEVSADCTVTLEGVFANPENYVIEINPGWNWIGFPCSQVVSIEDALADFEAEDGDQIKSAEEFSTYEDGEWGAMGDLEELVPGQGYKYFSASDTTKTLVFSTGAKARRKK